MSLNFTYNSTLDEHGLNGSSNSTTGSMGKSNAHSHAHAHHHHHSAFAAPPDSPSSSTFSSRAWRHTSTFFTHLASPHLWAHHLDDYFFISERDSTIWTEVRSGIVTFFTMAYILVVNAEILSKSPPNAAGESMSFDSVVVATALSAAFASALVGVWGNLPFGLAPGMGLNSYFTFGVCIRAGLSWNLALTCSFVQGVLFMFLSAIGACNLIQLYAPPCIKKSITVGLGLFQALIGFESMRLVVAGSDVLLALGDVFEPTVLLSLAGLMIICLLLVLEVNASMLIGMMFVTLVAWLTGLSAPPSSVIAMPLAGNTFFALDFAGYVANASATIPITLMFLFVAIFDTAGVQFMAGQQAELLDEDDLLPGSTAAFFSAGAATSLGALMGTSPVIIHNETCAGIQDGARTGLHSIVVALLFVLSLPFIPLLSAVPAFATAPPLIIVGMFMMMAAKFIDWERVDEAMPAFLTATLLPMTYSIANGMLGGLAAFAILKGGAWLGGRLKLSPPPSGALSAASASSSASASASLRPRVDRSVSTAVALTQSYDALGESGLSKSRMSNIGGYTDSDGEEDGFALGNGVGGPSRSHAPIRMKGGAKASANGDDPVAALLGGLSDTSPEQASLAVYNKSKHQQHQQHRPHAPDGYSPSGLSSFADPMPGSPVPPFAHSRGAHRQNTLGMLGTPKEYGTYSGHF